VLAVAVLGEAMILLEATVVNVALPTIGRDLGAGLLLLVQIHPGDRYLPAVLPSLIVFGVGLAALITPITAMSTHYFRQTVSRAASEAGDPAAG
jgi:hypothetical protein